MIFVHEIHEVVAGEMGAFEELLRTVWRPLLEERNDARLLWVWEHTHGTGPSYQAITISAIRDWATWGALVDRGRTDPRFVAWRERIATVRREVTSKVLLATHWSPLADVDLTARSGEVSTEAPTMY